MQNNNREKTGNRFVKGRKQEALAEIEAWVGGSREQIIKAGAAKVASHPAKNITEQKMLDSHLYDMSRQRFNFIVQCHWQSKVFLQKQKRKTSVMRDLLQNVDMSILSENPFNVRRKNAEQRKLQKKSQRSKSFPRLGTTRTKLPDIMKEEEEEGAEIMAGNVFVTQKFPSIVNPPQTDNKSPEENLNSQRSRDCSDALDWMWPISDSRYVRLSEVLCETYPKVEHLQAKRKHLNPIPAATGQ